MQILLQHWTILQLYDINKETFKEQNTYEVFFL